MTLNPELLSTLFESESAARKVDTGLGEAIRQARRERVVPLLVHLLAGDPEDHLFEVEAAIMAHAVALEAQVVSLAPMLSEAGVGSILLKGIAVAHLDYPAPHWRQFGDADLLISPSDFTGTLQVLRDAGWTNESEVPKRHLQFTHALPMRHPSGVIIDVHQSLGRRALGRLVPTEHLLNTSIPFEVAGVELRALADPFRLAHACIHWTCSRGQFKRLSGAADIIVMTQRLSPDDVVPSIESHRMAGFVRRGITDAFAIAEHDPPEQWRRYLAADAGRPTLTERAHLAPDRRPVLEELAFLATLAPREWATYLRGYLDVGGDYEAKHGRTGLVEQARYLRGKLRNRT